MRVLYTLSVYLYLLAIRVAALKNLKAKQWWTGRKKQCIVPSVKNAEEKIMWMHCASLGEFEQGRPLIEKIKKEHPRWHLILTFFSPSGYEVRKNYALAQAVYYLPADMPRNVQSFLDTIKPDMVFFVKYDFWFNYLAELQKRGIPTFLIAGRFHCKQIFSFPVIGRWFASHLKAFTHFFLLEEESGKWLEKWGYKNYSVNGDTRMDRVIQNKLSVQPNHWVENFKGEHLLVIGGSTWEKEEEILHRWYLEMPGRVKLMIAPHNVERENIERLYRWFGEGAILYSQIEKTGEVKKKKVLIVDNVGMLAQLYYYADIALVGGAFRHNLHNILEPAVFGVPLLFGPGIRKNQEAKDLVVAGGAFVFKDYEQFVSYMQLLLNDISLRRKMADILIAYVEKNQGAVTDIYYKLLRQGWL